MGTMIKARGTRNVVLEPGRVLHAGEVVAVTALQAAILRDCNAIELLNPDDAPLLRQAVVDENHRVMREARQRPMPSLDDGRWQPIGY
jgi:hypothetical protein